MNKRQKKKKTKIRNKKLIENYPFLLIRNRWTGEVIDNPYSFTELDFMPSGWRKAFGIKLCEELRQELVKHDCYDYRILQIKEKYGELRWYDNYSVGKSSKIINKYIELSKKTCICCGSQKGVEMTDFCGYISPYCTGCKKAIIERIAERQERILRQKL